MCTFSLEASYTISCTFLNEASGQETMKSGNKNFRFLNLVKYFFIFLFCVAATGLFSCSSLMKKVEEVSSEIPFNYPGLRFETRVIRAEDTRKNEPVIVCFGDSVTFGWNVNYDLSFPHLLEKQISALNPDVIVINSGVGGNTVKDAYKRLKKDVFAFGPDYIVINFGLNDAMLEKKGGSASTYEELFLENNGVYYVPQLGLDDFGYFYELIIESIKKEKIKALVMGITPVSDHFPAGQENEYNRKQKEIYEVYNSRINKIAAIAGFDFMDMFQVFNGAGDLNSYLQEDGIHPNERGLELISRSLFQYFEKIK